MTTPPPPHKHASGGAWGEEFCRAADYLEETQQLFLLESMPGSWWIIFDDYQYEESLLWDYRPNRP